MIGWRRVGAAMRNWVVFGAIVALGGCMLNDVREIRPDDWSAPGDDRAVLFFGLGAEGVPAEAAAFTVFLDEYDPRHGRTAGNCWRWNHARAVRPPTAPGDVQYVAFSAEPGEYAWSGFNVKELEAEGAASKSESIAFRAAAGRVTYLGDFILTPGGAGDSQRRAGIVVLRQNLAAATAAMKAFGTLAGEPLMAEPVPIRRQAMFLCAP